MIDFLRNILGSPEFTALIITAFAAATTTIVGWVAVQFRKRILRDLSSSDLALLRSIATIAVRYAEQRFKDADGPAKLAEAGKVANTMIAGYGLKVNVRQLLAIIEAAVYAETLSTVLPSTEVETP